MFYFDNFSSTKTEKYVVYSRNFSKTCTLYLQCHDLNIDLNNFL